MDLDFSFLTFSPSRRSLKSSCAGKSSSKRTLLQSRLNSAVESKGPFVHQATGISTTNVLRGEEKLPSADLNVCGNVLKSFDALHYKPTFKPRNSKGKENLGIDSYTMDLSSDSGGRGTTYATNYRKSCRLSCDQLHEDMPTKMKCSFEVVTSTPMSNNVDGLASKINICSSPCAKSCTLGGRSQCFPCCRNFPRSSTVLISKSSSSSVDETCNKRRVIDGNVNSSVIIVSDNSSTSSAIIDGTSKSQMKRSLPSCSRENKKGIQEVQCFTGGTSDSENDVLDASYEATHKLTLNVRTPLPSDLKYHTSSNTNDEKVGSPMENLEFMCSPKPPQLNHTKYQDIENWLSKIKPLKSGDYDDADTILEGSSPQKEQVTENGTKTSRSWNSSAEEILDNLYGAAWRKTSVLPDKPQTGPCKKKCSRNEQIARQLTKCKKHTVAESEDSTVGSTESEEFEKFLKNVQQKFETTSMNYSVATSDFIDDDAQDNSRSFYQRLFHSGDRRKDQLHLNWKMNSRTPHANVKLSFSSSDSDGPNIEHSCDANCDTSEPRTIEKKLHHVEDKKCVQRPKKVIVSPVKRSLVKKTPKTVGQTKLKSCVDKQTSKFCSPVLSFLASLSDGIPNQRCHPEAHDYKSNFRKKKEELCKKLFTLYNDKIFDKKLPQNMLVQWNARMKRSAGFCYNRWTVTSPGTKARSSRIAISTKVCDSASRLRDTLIHEMCHAAVWHLDGVKNGHGHCWQAWARKAARVFPELPPIKRCHDYSIQTKFTYRCTGCAYSIGRHSKSLNVATTRCGLCYGMFELLVNTGKKSGTIIQQAVKTCSPIGFARYVKENYGAVKQSRTDLKHADIMRLLGQQFSAMKIVPGKCTK